MNEQQNSQSARPRRSLQPDCSAADPRVGNLTSEDAAMLKKFAEDMGALDCMPVWMRSEIEAKTKPPNDKLSDGSEPFAGANGSERPANDLQRIVRKCDSY